MIAEMWLTDTEEVEKEEDIGQRVLTGVVDPAECLLRLMKSISDDGGGASSSGEKLQVSFDDTIHSYRLQFHTFKSHQLLGLERDRGLVTVKVFRTSICQIRRRRS